MHCCKWSICPDWQARTPPVRCRPPLGVGSHRCCALLSAEYHSCTRYRLTLPLLPAATTQVEKFLRTLGAKKISHMFTHLRKIAQHPLLIRYHFTDDMVKEIAAKAYDM